MESIITIEPLVALSSIRSENTPKPIERIWRSCCFSINPVAAKYFVQVSILAGLIKSECEKIRIEIIFFNSQ